ncbi:MAG: hypothetical protein MUC43_00185 [Pirellula sp.]|nr:hypothetical protein [Pirellula sp.]
MTTQTAKIVNYAFLQELKEENTPLWEDVLLLGSYGQEPFSSDWIEQNAGTLLRRLRDRISGQFRMEETLAYIPVEGITQSQPVTKALNQHLQILLHCIALSEQCDDFEYSGKLFTETYEIWKEMRSLYDEIMEHESLERRLLNQLIETNDDAFFGNARQSSLATRQSSTLDEW